MIHTRNAILPDVKYIHAIMERYFADGTLLPRQLPELCENVRDFVVAEQDGEIIGCGALHLYGLHLAEIRSIVVHPPAQRLGAGCLLVQALLKEAERHTVTCVCLFTRIPEFFARAGFSVASRHELPDKIYKDCIRCPRFCACDEIAMVRGQLPDCLEKPDVQFAVPLVRLSA
jgi:amino-acid N-acetyltransferase